MRLTTLPLAVGAFIAANLFAADDHPQPLALGAQAPSFTLPGVDGKDWSLSDFDQSELLAVIFTCNHCPTAQYYEERIKALVTDYQNRGVAVVAISPNDPDSVRLDELGWAVRGDTFEEMKEHAEERGFNFPYLYDGDTEAVSRQYGPLVTPHVFLFDQERKLRYAGAIDDSERPQHVETRYLRDAIDALLAGEEPNLAQTKVVGCSVKWAGKAHLVEDYMKKLSQEEVALEMADQETLAALRANDGTGTFRLVNFWATWCAPCVAEFDEFVTINRMYRHRDFEFVSVSMNRPDESDRVLAFLKKKQASNANYLFAQSKRDPLIDAFDPDWQGVAPYTVLINPEGEIVYREIGSIDPRALKRIILRELNARNPW
ncbi:redoxin domain-containing protein [Pelagicoccus sp. SDUM812003]|uniref:redoxin domain-containing protein n=1 Tax=Pelagicoccus sp. SDUM812003 TaxID=3041267 RepID=UPI00280D84BD|nr:redoxin domain-containing protein [Pelagicoccus sp. SDUM812003]MDQ8203100.1 redoxin domain-containing protein [Pelagicoccus sp. SDUM812003]